ncbi:hypothetical protein [Sulfurovum mangrovi]|uniref:hypothetical protein n=1 Tax=Sulfurovum mangrovi TaxID=2893889 RepID=UPI001E302275|nr:hypothetical protein [Sulfurovum mangrovi]UFH59850.1 hypothetical protein LN246_03155 [Sulfurovum mangrovi]UFH59901.1 hypothetical protein LN246_03415 [Sulfurovum mangrovi]
MGLTNIKYVFYVAIGVIFGGLYYYNHYLPISTLEKEKSQLQRELYITGYELNECKANVIKTGLDGFIDGIGEHNETTIIDIGNLHT